MNWQPMIWYPISEAPKDGADVISWIKDEDDKDDICKGHWDLAYKVWVSNGRIIRPTHFMLVTPPGEQQQSIPTELSKCVNELPRALCGGTYVGDCLDNLESLAERMGEQQHDVNQRLLAAAETALLALNNGVPIYVCSDKSINTSVAQSVQEQLRAAIEAAKQAVKGVAE